MSVEAIHPQLIALIALIALSGYVALHNIVLASGRGAFRAGGWVAAFMSTTVVHLLARLSHICATTAADASLAMRVELASVCVIPALVLGTVQALAHDRRRRELVLLGSVGVLLVPFVMTSTLFVTNEADYAVDASGLRYLWVTVGPLFGLPGVLGGLGFISCVRTALGSPALTRTHAAALVSAMSVYLLLGIFDVVASSQTARPVPLFQYSVVWLGAAMDFFAVHSLRTRKQAIEDGAQQQGIELFESNAALTESLEAARRAAETRGLILAKVSHELRTPLNAICGSAEILGLAPLTSEQHALARTILAEGNALGRMVSDAIEYVRVESGAVVARTVRDVDLRASIDALIEGYAHTAEAKGIALDVVFDSSLPAAVEVDPHRVRQVLAIVIDDALTRASAGEIAVGVDATDDRIRISVRDCGPLMDEDQRAMLFEPFHSLRDGNHEATRGLGLGLPTARVVLERMGGTIEVAPFGEKANVFRLTVPARGSVSTDVEHARESIHGAANASASSASEGVFSPGTRVLVVEDIPLNRQVVGAMLGALGVACEFATDGEQGIRAFGDGARFDAILMDCQMPVVDGFEATVRIRARERERDAVRTPIIAVTALALPEAHARATESGMDAIIVKPISLDVLRRTLARALPTRCVAATPQPFPAPDTASIADGDVVASVAAEDVDFFDPKYFDDLRATGVDTNEFFTSLLGSFRTSARKYVAAMLRGVETNDAGAISRAAHALKGCAGSFGAVRVARRAREFEKRERECLPEPAELADLLAIAEAAGDVAERWIRANTPPAA